MYSDVLKNSLATSDKCQLAVARIQHGSYAVVGNPGAGKTRALVQMLARIVADGQDPKRVLAMTFTKNAAEEMLSRLETGYGITGMRVGTIHSVCYQVLREYTDSPCHGLELKVGSESEIRLSKLLSKMKRSKEIPRKIDRDVINKFIQRCKTSGAHPIAGNPLGINSALLAAAQPLAKQMHTEAGLHTSGALASIMLKLDTERQLENAFDFDDMILWTWQLFIVKPVLLDEWRHKFDYIIVDECQDSSPLQWDTARLLSGRKSWIAMLDNETASQSVQPIMLDKVPNELPEFNSLIMFGDIAQSIYRFRGAVPELFLDYTKEAGVEVLQLPYNYRSTPGICEAGSALIAGKEWHLAGDMIAVGKLSSLSVDETLPTVETYADCIEEADAIAVWAKEAHAQGKSAVVLSRMCAPLDLVEISLIGQHIPYIKMTGRSFLESKQVKDILSYLYIASGWDATGEYLTRAVNAPMRFIGRDFMNRCIAWSIDKKCYPLDGLQELAPDLKTPMQRSAIREFIRLITWLNKHLKQILLEDNERELNDGSKEPEYYENIGDLLRVLIKKIGYLEAIKEEDGLGATGDKEAAVMQIVRMANKFRDVSAFLNYITELKNQIANARRSKRTATTTATTATTTVDSKAPVLLSTVHRFKGLEQDCVWIMDVTEGRFPHRCNSDQDEELRLFYVAVTRAKAECIISTIKNAQSTNFLKIFEDLKNR